MGEPSWGDEEQNREKERVDRKMEGWKNERGREKQRGEGERMTTADRKQGVVTENEAED